MSDTFIRRPISRRTCPLCGFMVKLFPDGITLRTHGNQFASSPCIASKTTYKEAKAIKAWINNQ